MGFVRFCELICLYVGWWYSLSFCCFFIVWLACDLLVVWFVCWLVVLWFVGFDVYLWVCFGGWVVGLGLCFVVGVVYLFDVA